MIDSTHPSPDYTLLRRWLPLVIIISVCIGAYANSFNGQFVLDDLDSIVQNPSIKSIDDSFFPPDTVNIFRRHVVNVTLAINHAISGLDVWSYHLFNLLIHMGSALLLFALFQDAFSRIEPAKISAAKGTWLATVTASIWAVHPLQTQAVTYIIQRCESLAALCVFSVVLLAVRSMTSRNRWPWIIAAWTVFIIGIWVKESIVLGIFLALFFDRTFISGTVAAAIQNHRALYIGFLGCFGVFLLNVLSFMAVSDEVLGLSPFAYAISQPEVIIHYLLLTVWPADLCLDYAWPISEISRAIPYIAFILSALVGSVWLALKRNRYGFFLCWFWITIATSSSFIPIPDLAFEHRMYLPLGGLAGAAVLAAWDILTLLGKKSGRDMAGVGLALWVIVVCALGVRTAFRNADYAKGQQHMWEDVLSKRPENVRALTLVGYGHAEQKNFDKAFEYYNKAIAIDPDSFLVHNDLAILYKAMGDMDKAETHLREMIRIKPTVPMPYLSLAQMMMQQREMVEAALLMEKAVELNPKLLNVRAQLAQIYYRSGQRDKAVEHLNAYLAEKPDNKQAKQMLQAIKGY